MPTWLLATALLAAPGSWSPAEAPPPTPWAMAGARGWRLCQEAERQARAAGNADGARGRGVSEDPVLWKRRARQCPHAVQVLLAAARAEILEAADLFREIDSRDAFDDVGAHAIHVQGIVEDHREKSAQALRWLDAAVAESERRGQRPPYQTLYYRAYALTAMGRVSEAREALHEVTELGDVQRWRSERMLALVELMAGNTEEALRRAQRGVFDAPDAGNERVISRYIRALVLDRAGAPAVARAELRAVARLSGSANGRQAMESVLPIHERLFFRALNDQANDNHSPALRFWQAYLERPEPEAPERVLARRHLEELTPPPVPAGGP